MRIGPLEIRVIIIIILAILLVARIVRARSYDTERSKETPTDIVAGGAKDNPGRIQSYLKKLGIAFLVAGILSALAGASMFRMAVQGYAWAFGAVTIGFVLLFLVRKNNLFRKSDGQQV